MTRLFIENREIELDKSVQFAITKQFEVLSNPTDIINDWSKTVSIPFTANNNEIFGHIYNPDRLIVVGSSDTLTGIYFDPSKKLDMRIQYGDNVLMTGYAKMNEIKQSNGKGTYEITLFGQLGKIFQELKKITFDTTTEDTNYLIHGEDYVDRYIDRSLILDSWKYQGQSTMKLLKKTDKGYNINDILGWAPNNSYSEGFDYKTFQSSATNSTLFKDTLETRGFTEATGIDPDTAIQNGMTPRGIGEYRSYQQLPYIYWNKLFQIFQEKAEAITGYTFDLDRTFFTKKNPDWYNLVYMLKTFQSTGQTAEPNYKNTYKLWIPDSGYIYWGSAEYTKAKSTILGATISLENFKVLETGLMSPENGYTFNLDDFSGRIVGELPCCFRYLTYQEYYKNSQLNPANAFVFTLNVLDETTNTVLSSAQYLLCRSNTSIDKTAYRNIIENDSISVGYNDKNLTDQFNFTVPINAFIPRGHKINFSINGRFIYQTVPMVKVGGGGQNWLPKMNLYLRSNEVTLNLAQEIRSNSHFILNDLWNKDFNLFDEILKYCKMYRIYVYTDDFEKKIYFIQHKSYFEKYTIEDWTNKLDKSKDFVIKPITFENKYVLFNYENDKTRLDETYREKYGLNIGEYRLNTDYNFNDKTVKLFSGIKNSINNTDNVLSWGNIYDNKRLVYSFPNEIYVFCKDKNEKYTDVFGKYYYFGGLTPFSTEPALYMRSVKITDDTVLQTGSNTFFYSQGYNSTSVENYPKLDIVYSDNLCLFNTPKENYTYINNYGDKKTIYYKYWQKYLNERYNIQNKVVTCYLTLTPQDWVYFQFNKFIKINNLLYIVNKIYDYNIETMESTKVDMVSINDITGYTTDNYIIDDSLVLNFAQVSYIDGNVLSQPGILGTFETLSKVYFENGTEKYTIHNIEFTIDNNENTVYYQTLSKYVDKEDLNFTITLHNSHNSGTIKCQRYSIYPYPWIIIENDKGTEVSTIYPGTRVYKLKWHGTDTTGLDNKPTVTIENHGTGSAAIQNDWTENEVMIQEGDNEWFKNEYVVTLKTGMTNYSNTYLRFIVTDKEGWHETRDYYVSL